MISNSNFIKDFQKFFNAKEYDIDTLNHTMKEFGRFQGLKNGKSRLWGFIVENQWQHMIDYPLTSWGDYGTDIEIGGIPCDIKSANIGDNCDPSWWVSDNCKEDFFALACYDKDHWFEGPIITRDLVEMIGRRFEIGGKPGYRVYWHYLVEVLNNKEIEV